MDGRTVNLNTAGAASHLGFKAQTLRRWRMHGGGPRYCRAGNGPHARVVYRLADLDAWLASRSFGSTAEEAQRGA